MSHSIDAAFIEKMLEAKKLEKEAIMLLLPDHIKEHINVISMELKAMLVDIILDANVGTGQSSETNSQTEKNNRVKKVDIG